MKTYTIDLLTNDMSLEVTIRHIPAADATIASGLALSLMGDPDLWMVSAIYGEGDFDDALEEAGNVEGDPDGQW